MERTKELLRIVTLADETFAVLMERLWAHYHAPLGTNINFEHTYRRPDGTPLSLLVALGKASIAFFNAVTPNVCSKSQAIGPRERIQKRLMVGKKQKQGQGREPETQKRERRATPKVRKK